jgi:hypothetical protein
MPRYENKRSKLFFEIVRDRVTVRTCTGQGDSKRLKEQAYESEDDARYAYGKQLAKYRSFGATLVGMAQHLAEPRSQPASDLLLDTYFVAGDDRFLDEVLRSASANKLANLAERWASDARPWAREMLLAYIDDGCDRPEHKGLVKRLFKRIEKAGDDEAMAHFLVAFDTLPRRVLIKAWEYSTTRVLRADPNFIERLVHHGTQTTTHPQFSRATRRYLARRTYRYFRNFARRNCGTPDLPRYAKWLRHALALYRDESLATAAQLLDAWGLVHALYHYSPVLAIEPRGIHLADGKSLGELAPAPHFPDAWRGCFAELVDLLVTAKARTVRAWTAAWLRASYATELKTLTFGQVKALITSPHDELQVLGAELLGSLTGLETLAIAEWLELLAVENLEIIPAICDVVERHVTPARLPLAQCIDLACAKTAPVARLGLQWARGKRIDSADDLKAIMRLAKAGVATVRVDGTAWASEILRSHPKAQPEHLRDLCDAPHADAREQALTAVVAETKLAPSSLWFALTESPYDDVRKVVVANATKWRAEAPKQTLRHVWTTAILAVNGGSATKRRVPRAIAERIASHPDEAAELLPILRLALRSVRPAERAAALTALARAAQASPTLRELAHELIPELTLTEQVTS